MGNSKKFAERVLKADEAVTPTFCKKSSTWAWIGNNYASDCKSEKLWEKKLRLDIEPGNCVVASSDSISNELDSFSWFNGWQWGYFFNQSMACVSLGNQI